MRAAAFLAILFLGGATDAFARRGEKGIETHWFGSWATESVSFVTSTGSEASYKTSSVGAGMMLKFNTEAKYGLGLKGAFQSRKGTNSANGEVNASGVREEESLSATVIDLGVRFYALDFFVGMGVTVMPLTIGYTSSARTVSTETKYNSFGVNLELGMDLFLGENFFFSPKVEYRTGSASASEGTARSHRISGFGAGVAVGLAF